MKKRILSNFMLVLTAIIWGFAFVAQKNASDYIGAFTFNGVRFLFGAISLIPVILIFERDDFKDKLKLKNTVKYGIITGVILCIASALQQISLVYISQTSKAGFITGLYTVWVPIILMFTGKKARINSFIGAIFAVVGLYLISVVGMPMIEFGDFILLIGSFFWAFHVLAIDKFVSKISPIKYSFIQFTTCAILNLMIVPFTEISTFTFANLGSSLIPLLYTGVMSSGVAYTFQILGQKNSEPTEATIILSTETVFSAIGCALLLGEKMSVQGYIGSALIFAGIILSQLNFKTKEISQ